MKRAESKLFFFYLDGKIFKILWKYRKIKEDVESYQIIQKFD